MTQMGLDFEADIARDVERLSTLAGELAMRNGNFGVTVGDLRLAAETRGWLTGEESEARMKQLSLNRIMRRAGLYRTNDYRPSPIKRAHANPNRVWVAREWAEVA